MSVHPSDASGASDSLHAVGAVTINRATNKSLGLAVVAKQLGLGPSDVVAFGDATNDLEMFAWAGHSICPTNGSVDAKAAATHCSPLSNDEDFIAQALQSATAFDGSQSEPPAKRPKGALDAMQLPLTAEGKLHLMLNMHVGGAAAEVHRRAVQSVAERFAERLVGTALAEGRTYPHLSLVYDFYIEPARLTELEVALRQFASKQAALTLHFSQVQVWDGRVVSFHVDESSPAYAAARATFTELIAILGTLNLLPSDLLAKPVQWHATVAMRDAGAVEGFNAESICEHVRELGGLPASFSFDNITIMVKDGPPGPYRSSAKPARRFDFGCRS